MFAVTNPGGGSTYYYGDSQYHAQFNFETRKIEEELSQMFAIENEECPTIRAQLSRTSGYTRVSILQSLYKLYKFDVFIDLVYDVMYNMPLNVVARQLKNWIESEAVDKAVIEKRLKSFSWTAGRQQRNLTLKRS